MPLFVFPDAMVSVLFGEVIHNLRTSLDYLIYALSWVDSGAFQEGTQFPIDDCRNEFERRERGISGKRSRQARPNKPRLKGLSTNHIARIEQLQPYNGCDWTKLLRELSNHDKHRELIRVTGVGKFAVKIGSIADLQAQGVAEIDMKMKSTLSGEVTFGDGMPVIGTLQRLQSQVAHVLNEFDPIFSSVR